MKKETKINILDKTFHGILKAISLSYKDAADFCDFDSYTSENFYDGTVPFLKKPQKGCPGMIFQKFFFSLTMMHITII